MKKKKSRGSGSPTLLSWIRLRNSRRTVYGGVPVSHTGIVDTDGKFTVVTGGFPETHTIFHGDTGGKLAPVSTKPAVNL